MSRYLLQLVVLFVFCAAPLTSFAGAASMVVFKGETPGKEAKAFTSLVGNWHVDTDGNRTVYAVDGRQWEQGLMSPNASEKARMLYGKQAGTFLAGINTYRYFPLSVYKGKVSFKNGTVQVSFKTVSGAIDQGAGIAFDIRPDGNYLVLRVNPLENNMILFRMEGGRRKTLQWTQEVPTPSQQWQTLKVEVNGKRISGYLNGKKYLDHTLDKPTERGRIGLWSKSDSYVFFDDFRVSEE